MVGGSAIKQRSSGFTLLELLVVLVLMALVTGVAVPLLSAAMPGVQLKSAVRDVLAGLRQAREQAILTQKPAALTIDVSKRTIWLSDRRGEKRLPKDIQITLVVAGSAEGAQQGSFVFYPDGSSTGGHVILSLDGSKYRINVDWLTGLATVQG